MPECVSPYFAVWELMHGILSRLCCMQRCIYFISKNSISDYHILYKYIGYKPANLYCTIELRYGIQTPNLAYGII